MMKEIIAQLRPALDELASTGRQAQVFFRDDDVDEDEPTLHQLLECFIRCDVPINLEVIPGRLTISSIGLLNQCQRYQPGLIELDQHGWQHVNHEPTGRKCEFGSSRSYDQQYEDIARGRKMLESAFGAAFSPVFTPPWNRCTPDTFRVLDELGFQVLSRDSSNAPITGYGFRELSITLDLYRWKNGAAMKAPEEIIRELGAQCRTQTRVGIMLHHKVMDEIAFELLEAMLTTLRQHPAVQLHSFQSLMQQYQTTLSEPQEN